MTVAESWMHEVCQVVVFSAWAVEMAAGSAQARTRERGRGFTVRRTAKG